MKGKKPIIRTPLRVGPLAMRLSTERDPRLRELSEKEGVERGLGLMAFSLDRLREAVSTDLRTHDERRIACEMRRLIAQFGRTDRRWRELRSPK